MRDFRDKRSTTPNRNQPATTAGFAPGKQTLVAALDADRPWADGEVQLRTPAGGTQPPYALAGALTRATERGPHEFGHNPAAPGKPAVVAAARAGSQGARVEGGRIVLGGDPQPAVQRSHSLEELGHALGRELPFERYRAQREGDRVVIDGKLNPWVRVVDDVKQLRHGERPPADGDGAWERQAEPMDVAHEAEVGETGETGRAAKWRKLSPPEDAPRSPAQPDAHAGKQIVQCGNMTGDMFVIAAALRLDPTLTVRVIWDRGYYVRVHEAIANDLNLTLLEVFNRGKLPGKQAPSDAAARATLAEKMELNAKRIAAFYRGAGIAGARITIEESDPARFPNGSYDDEYKAIKEQVLPKDGGKGSDELAVPGYATSTVQHAFQNDRIGAQDTVRGMFDGISEVRRAQIDQFRAEKLGRSRVVLLWSRGSSRSPGGGNTGLDTDPSVLEQLVGFLSGQGAPNADLPLPPFRGTPWIIGDEVPDASPALQNYLQGHDLTHYWDKLTPKLTEVEQMFFLDQVRLHNAGCAIGMISGILEIPAILGMPTAYFELSFMRQKGKRWEKMAGKNKHRPDTGPVPQLNQLEISADQEYAANMREVQKALAHWLTTPSTAAPVNLARAHEVIQQVIQLGERRGERQEPFRFDPDRMDRQTRQLGLAYVKGVGARLADLSRFAPPDYSLEERRWMEQQFAQARQNFALTPEELDSLGWLLQAWENAEVQARSRRNLIAPLGRDPGRLVETLRAMSPQANIALQGENIVIDDGRLTLSVVAVEDRLQRDPKWVARQLRVDRPRTLHADQPLTVSTDANAALLAAQQFTGAGVKMALSSLRAALGDRAFAGLVADLADMPQALGELLPAIDMAKLAQVAALIGPDAVAGIMVEHRASPGRFVTFIQGTLARRSDLEAGNIEEFDDDDTGRLDGAKILDSNLAMSMHRASLPPEARELALRPRRPQERSQVLEIQRKLTHDETRERPPNPAVYGSAAGYSRGNGRRMRVGTEYDLGLRTGASLPLRTLPIDAEDRQSGAYTTLLQQLAALRIRNAGRAQLAELADVFMAAKKTASKPTFHTGSIGILDALGEQAGYPVADREPRDSYAKFFEAKNREKSGGTDHRPSFTCTLDGASVEIVPVDAVKFSKPAPSTRVAGLGRTVMRTGTRLHDGTRVVAEARVAGGPPQPANIEGTLAGYTVDGKYLVRNERGVTTVDPAEYDVRVTAPGEPRVYDGKTIAEVQEMFPTVVDIAGKLQNIATRTVASEIQNIQRHTVKEYIDVIVGAGFDVYVVGGAVRDIVSGKKDPADIDLATTMPAIDALGGFEGNRLADRQGAEGMPRARTIPQHGITQVEHQVETGLDVVSLHSAEHGVHPMDLETDVANRDFTINALFYDVERKVVIDPTGFGLADLKSNTMRWTCAAKGGDDAIRAKLRNDSYQIGRWIKFRIKDMTPARTADVEILNEVFAEHVANGLTPEEKARILDGIGKPLSVALAKAGAMGVRPDLLMALDRVD